MLNPKTFLLFFLIFSFFPQPAFAQLDCCGAHGGNYACDFSTKQLYCKDGTVSTVCSCTPQNTPTPTIGPTETPTPTPTNPPCPNFASYDASSKSCKCVSGYVVNENVCVPNVEYCWIKYGGNATYDRDKNACSCPQGYTWNSDSTKCISYSQLCQNKLGSKSYYNSDSNSCNCYQGYSIHDNACQIIPTETITEMQKMSIVIPSTTPSPTPTPSKTPTPIKSGQASTEKPQKPTPTFGLKLGKDFDVSPKTPRPNIIVELIKGIWDFVSRLI